jgi:hypothetical protein
MKHKSDAEAARRYRHAQAERMIEMFKQAHSGRRPLSRAELADWLDAEKAAGRIQSGPISLIQRTSSAAALLVETGKGRSLRRAPFCYVGGFIAAWREIMVIEGDSYALTRATTALLVELLKQMDGSKRLAVIDRAAEALEKGRTPAVSRPRPR